MSKTSPEVKSGKIGKIIKYYRNGTHCERMCPESVFNPKTEKQQLVRSKFGLASIFGSNVLHSLIHPYWNSIAKNLNRTGYNLFLSDNQLAFRNGVFNVESLRLCRDNGLSQEDFKAERSENLIKFHWDSSLTDHRKNNKDQLHLIILFNDLKCKIIETRVIRENNYFEFDFSDSNLQYLFVFWKNGGKWSASKLVFVSS